MKKVCFLLIVFSVTLFGYEYDKLLLKAQANIFPKLILLDQDISKKVINKEIVFCIVYHQSDYIKTMQIKKIVENRYEKSLEEYKLKIVLKRFDEVKDDKSINAYYILQGESLAIKRVCNIAKKRNIPTFTYDPYYFVDDVLISLVIQNNSVIYLNKKVHKLYNINFVDVFYQIVRFWDD